MMYTVKTDALQQDIVATSFDEAAAAFAAEEGIDAKTVNGVIEAISRIDGAWFWIENEEGDRISTPRNE